MDPEHLLDYLVMEIQLVKKYEGLRMDQVITFKGKLRLNVELYSTAGASPH